MQTGTYHDCCGANGNLAFDEVHGQDWLEHHGGHEEHRDGEFRLRGAQFDEAVDEEKADGRAKAELCRDEVQLRAVDQRATTHRRFVFTWY